MTPFGGLFGHDRVSARASGKFTDDPAPMQLLPSAPPMPQAAPQSGYQLPGAPTPPAMTGDVGSGFSFAPTAAAQLDQLPSAPPASPKKAGAFDADHYRQTMLAMAAGFFGSHDFGDGLANAAKAIYAGNEDATKRTQVSYGGPDDAFEITTDPHTGKRSYTPVQAVVDYEDRKASKMTPDKLLDFNGRYALQLQGITDPTKRTAAAQFMAANPTLYPGFNGALAGASDDLLRLSASAGQTVTQSGAAAQRATGEANREADRAYKRGQGDKRIQLQADKNAATIRQGDARINLATDAGGRAAHRLVTDDLKKGIKGGYRYFMQNGKMMKEKVF